MSTTFGPIQQPSSSTENSGMNAWVWMRTLSPMTTWCSTTESVPTLTLLANLIRLADVHLIAGLEIASDDVTGINDGMRTYRRSFADRRRQLAGLTPEVVCR